MKQHSASRDTMQAIEAAMTRYEAQVLDPLRQDKRTCLYSYDERVTINAILKLAGVHYRSTLCAEYHEGLRDRVHDLIRKLKKKTGKVSRRASSAKEPPENAIPRVDALAQTIAALNFRIMKQEKEPFPEVVGRATLSGATRARRQRQPPSRR
jgi:hypothetical protein